MFDLKSYLLSNFHDKKYKGKSLIYLFVNEKKHYESMVKEKLIHETAISFLKKYEKELNDAEIIKNEAFRKLRYEVLIDEYLHQLTNAIETIEIINI